MSDRAFRIVVAPTERLDETARAGIIRACAAASPEADFELLFTYIPSGGRHVVGYRGAEVVSHAVVSTRWLQPAGEPLLRTAYVDAVATHPAHQGRGFGSAVLRRLVFEIADYDIACLETERPTFFERLGWQLWRGPLAGRTDSGLIPTPDQQGVMVYLLPQSAHLDLDANLSIESDGGRIW